MSGVRVVRHPPTNMGSLLVAKAKEIADRDFGPQSLSCVATYLRCLYPTPHCFSRGLEKVNGVDEVQMIVTSADQVRAHVQTVTTYAADFDEVQKFELDANDVDEWQYAFTNVAETVYENQVCFACRCRAVICPHASANEMANGQPVYVRALSKYGPRNRCMDEWRHSVMDRLCGTNDAS